MSTRPDPLDPARTAASPRFPALGRPKVHLVVDVLGSDAGEKLIQPPRNRPEHELALLENQVNGRILAQADLVRVGFPDANGETVPPPLDSGFHRCCSVSTTMIPLSGIADRCAWRSPLHAGNKPGVPRSGRNRRPH